MTQMCKDTLKRVAALVTRHAYPLWTSFFAFHPKSAWSAHSPVQIRFDSPLAACLFTQGLFTKSFNIKIYWEWTPGSDARTYATKFESSYAGSEHLDDALSCYAQSKCWLARDPSQIPTDKHYFYSFFMTAFFTRFLFSFVGTSF